MDFNTTQYNCITVRLAAYATFETKKTNTMCRCSPLSMAAHRQLLRKILPPVSPLLDTWSTSMEPIVVLVINELC